VQKLKSILIVALVALFAVVPTASASVTDQIVADAQDGHIDGTYTAAQLQAALDSPLLAIYGGDGGVEAVKSSLGGQTTATTGSGTLPFTGAEVFTFVGIGGALVIAGIVLRRTDRNGEAA